jgi:hypothetical protein
LNSTGSLPRGNLVSSFGHHERLTPSTDKNVDMRANTFNGMFGDNTRNAVAKHLRPHAESAHLCLQGTGAKLEMLSHHLGVVFDTTAASDVVHR